MDNKFLEQLFKEQLSNFNVPTQNRPMYQKFPKKAQVRMPAASFGKPQAVEKEMPPSEPEPEGAGEAEVSVKSEAEISAPAAAPFANDFFTPERIFSGIIISEILGEPVARRRGWGRFGPTSRR
jgi:hypothetical protein